MSAVTPILPMVGCLARMERGNTKYVPACRTLCYMSAAVAEAGAAVASAAAAVKA